MVEEINLEQIVNIDRWVKENDENFKPPVCNAIMYICYYVLILPFFFCGILKVFYYLIILY